MTSKIYFNFDVLSSSTEKVWFSYTLLARHPPDDHSQAHSRLLPSEEVDVSKLLHLLNITTKRDLLVVEEDPALFLADEGDVVTMYS